MACRRVSVAPASARRCTIQLSRLQLVLHNLPHSSKHVDVLELMMGRSMLDGQLPSGLSASGLCRSPAPARRRALRAWQDGLAVWASHWAGLVRGKKQCTSLVHANFVDQGPLCVSTNPYAHAQPQG